MLVYLALQGATNRKTLLELFWQSGKPANLRFALFKLRGLKGAESWLRTETQWVSVAAESDAGAVEEALRAGNPLDALELWPLRSTASKLLLEGFELPDAPHFMSWLESERTRFAQLYLDTLRGSAEGYERQERWPEALALIRRLLGEDPLDEAAYRAAMRLEYRQGNSDAALTQFETCRHLLKEELGVEPVSETLELLRTIEGEGVSQGSSVRLLSSAEAVPELPERFIGRADLLRELSEMVATHKRVLLHGFGGNGKTALAAAFAAQQLGSEGKQVLWLPVGDAPPDALLDTLAFAFDARTEVSRAADKADALRRVLSRSGVTLVVLDDVWNAYSLARLLEVFSELPVLVTSRQRYPQLRRLEVGRLTRPEAVKLLGFYAGRNPTGEEADALCETLGDHAFALRLAGLTLAVEELSAGGLLEQIKTAPHRLSVPTDLAAAGQGSITALLETSLAALPEEAHEVFMACGVLAAPSATPELLALCTRRDEEVTEEALFALQGRGLAERVSEPGKDVVRYRLHDLAYSLARANHHHRPSTALRACRTLLARHLQDFAVLDAELPNLLGALELAGAQGDQTVFTEMMRELTVGHAYFRARGHTPRSLALLEQAVTAAKTLSEPETAHHLVARLGDAYREQYRDYEAALTSYREALELARAYGLDHREIVMLTLLGTTLGQKGDAEGSERRLEQAHHLAERRGDTEALCQVLEHRGCAAAWAGRLGDARALFAEGLGTLERLPPETDAAEVARLRFFMLLNAGDVERQLGNVQGSLAYRTEALELAEAQQNQLWTAYAFHELGETYHHFGNRVQAQEMYGWALELYQQNRVSSSFDALTAFLKEEGYSLPFEES